MVYGEGYFVIQPCPCCSYAPAPTEVEVDEEHSEELQTCPKCGQESIELSWKTGQFSDDEEEEDY